MAPTRATPVDPHAPALRRRALLTTGLAAGVASLAAATGGRTAGASTAPIGSSGDAGSPDGFASPDDAVAAYLGALAAGDFDGAVATFAVEAYVEHYDLVAALRRLRIYLPLNAPQILPNSDPFNVAINLAQRRATVATEVTNQYFALVNPDLDRSANGLLLEDDAAVAELIGQLEAAMTPAPLSDLADHELTPIEELDARTAELLASEQTTELDEQLRTVAGADESAELAVRTTVGGRPVALLFRAIRYGDRWWLETLQGPASILLSVEPLTPGVLWLDGGAGADGSAPASSSTSG